MGLQYLKPFTIDLGASWSKTWSPDSHVKELLMLRASSLRNASYLQDWSPLGYPMPMLCDLGSRRGGWDQEASSLASQAAFPDLTCMLSFCSDLSSLLWEVRSGGWNSLLHLYAVTAFLRMTEDWRLRPKTTLDNCILSLRLFLSDCPRLARWLL